MEEEEEPKEGEEPKAEVASVVFPDVGIVIVYSKCVIDTKSFFALFLG